MDTQPSGGHPAMDYAEHQRTYKGFIRGAIILAVAVVTLLVAMLYFLV